jgi:hypothetical protein
VGHGHGQPDRQQVRDEDAPTDLVLPPFPGQRRRGSVDRLVDDTQWRGLGHIESKTLEILSQRNFLHLAVNVRLHS